MTDSVQTNRPTVFSEADFMKANQEWGCNCGPSALAAFAGITLDHAREVLPSFDTRRYTNPSMMKQALETLNQPYAAVLNRTLSFSGIKDALIRIQWDGPWMRPGVPAAAAYQHTHWITAKRIDADLLMIFDCNNYWLSNHHSCGWTPEPWWHTKTVPYILAGDRQYKGYYFPTHIWEFVHPTPDLP